MEQNKNNFEKESSSTTKKKNEVFSCMPGIFRKYKPNNLFNPFDVFIKISAISLKTRDSTEFKEA